MSEDNSKQRENNDWDDDGSWDNWADAEEDLPDIDKSCNAPSKEEHKSSDDSKANSTSSLQVNDTKTKDEGKEDEDCHRRSEKQDSPAEVRKRPMEVAETTLMPRSSGWGSLFGGVVSSVLNTASEGLGNITSTVSQGLDKVIGVPDPAELARINSQAEAQAQAQAEAEAKDDNKPTAATEKEDVPSVYALKFGTQLVNGVTNLGSKVISTGLDTLEGIGKKTMDILQENDPQIKHKIKMLALEPEQPNLSQVKLTY